MNCYFESCRYNIVDISLRFNHWHYCRAMFLLVIESEPFDYLHVLFFYVVYNCHDLI